MGYYIERIVDDLTMEVDFTKQELDEKIKQGSQTNKSELLNHKIIKNRKVRFVAELQQFKNTNTEEHLIITSRIIKICEETPKEVFLLKIFSDNYYNQIELQNKSTFIVMLFNKIHSIILNSSNLSTEERLDCVCFQRILMRLYSKALT